VKWRFGVLPKDKEGENEIDSRRRERRNFKEIHVPV
jgi:hypothetical protein